jgi:hypothetical protein
VKESENCNLSDFEKGQIVRARLAGASMTKTVTGYVGIHESWEDNISEEKQWVKINNGKRDRRTLRRIASKNHRSTAAQVTAELNIHLEDPVPIKTVQRGLHRSNMYGRASIAKPPIT